MINDLSTIVGIIGIIVTILGIIVGLRTLGISWHGFWFVVVLSVLLTCLVMWGRWQGKLQIWELNAFDHLMRQQPVRGRDKKLLVVSVTQEDIERLNQPDEETGQGARSLSDRTLDRLVKRLKEHKPRVIGLDIFRPGDVDGEQYPNLKASLRTGSLTTVCHPPSKLDQRSIPAPEDAHEDSIGFAGVLRDEDEIIRRHLMLMKVADRNLCQRVKNVPSFSFRLAHSYLEKKYKPEDIKRKDKPNDDFIRLGDIKLHPFDHHAGGYHKANLDEMNRNFQVVLNYRPYQKYEDIAQIISITDILDSNKPSIAAQAEDKLVLIGRTDLVTDMHKTPFTTKHSQKLPGVLLQAQLVSQIIDKFEKKRTLIWACHWLIDACWIWLWSLVGGVIAWQVYSVNWPPVQSLLTLIICGGVAFGILYGLCWYFLNKGGWIPLVPSGLALFIPSGIVAIYKVLKILSKVNI